MYIYSKKDTYIQKDGSPERSLQGAQRCTTYAYFGNGQDLLHTQEDASRALTRVIKVIRIRPAYTYV
jgi:hypothetical protein